MAAIFHCVHKSSLKKKKNEQKEPNEHLYFNFEFYRTSLITFNVSFFNLSCE